MNHAPSVFAVLLLAAGPVAGQPYTFSTVATFNGTTSGGNPQSGLVVDSSGNLYGTTLNGGTNGTGTVFRVDSGSSTVTTLATFDGVDSNFFNAKGAFPTGRIVRDTNGDIYGAARGGGPTGSGSVYRVANGSGTVTALGTFADTNGSFPSGGVVRDSATGNIFGTTFFGGSSGAGAVFQLAGSNLTALASFNFTNGTSPAGGVVRDASTGDLYGTTSAGGASDAGTIFRLASGSTTPTTLFTFNGTTNGGKPVGGLLRDAAGILYGTTASGSGATAAGSVFKYDTSTSTFTTLASFAGSVPPDNIQSGLVMDAAGNLFGTTNFGGVNTAGTVFKIAAGTNTFTTLHVFSSGTFDAGGRNPSTTLALGTDGTTLFGTTAAGGLSNNGTIFKLELAPVPEPAAVLAVAAAGVGLIRLRRKRAAVAIGLKQ